MSVAVVGPGSVGLFFAAHLAAAGVDVVSCARRPFDEYIVDSATAPVRLPANVVTDPALITAPVEFVLVALKAQHTAGAAEWLPRLCSRETVVVAVQNGLEAAERLAPYVNGAEVLQAVVYCGGELIAPGHTSHSSMGFLWLPDSDGARRVEKLFEGCTAQASVRENYTTELWRKLGANVAANGITALTVKPFRVFKDPGIAIVATRLLDETWTVARADGAEIAPEAAAQLVASLASITNEQGTSTYQDRKAGRPTEHDAIFGAVVRAAERHGIAVPTVETVWYLLAGGDPD
jgi:2-dehydropantoate 2-reductase